MLRLALLLLLLWACHPLLAQPDELYIFEPTPCWFDRPTGYQIRCGYVPLSPHTAQVNSQLAVAVFKRAYPQPNLPPLLFIGGEEGEQVLSQLELRMTTLHALQIERDIILFDPRGVGYSGGLSCESYQQQRYDQLNLPAEAALSAALSDCFNTYHQAGRRFADYNTAATAADLYAAINALGYAQVDILAQGPAGRTALALMQQHPEIIRSVVLDNVPPPSINLLAAPPQNAAHAFRTLFTACAEDTACKTTYPNLQETLRETVAQLNTTPATIHTYDFYTNTARTVILNGDRLLEALYHYLHYDYRIADVPRLIDAAHAGDYTALTDELLYAAYQQQFTDTVTTVALTCATANQPELQTIEAPAWLRQPFEVKRQALQTLCDTWGQPTPPQFNTPLQANIPTLILEGHYAPYNLPEWTAQLSEMLPDSYHVVFPYSSQNILDTQPCAMELVQQFLAVPQQMPTADCMAQIPPPLFAIIPIQTVTLRDYADTSLHIASVIPEGWHLTEAGVFSPYPTLSQPMPLIAFRIQNTLDDYINRIIVHGFYSYPSLPDPHETLTINGRVWRVYLLERPDQSVYASFAMSDTNGAYVIAITASSPAERTYLHHSLLHPAMTAFRVLESTPAPQTTSPVDAIAQPGQ